ncbi:MAG: DUF3885 domain-containing protein [Raineya sp.]|jgi:hypothetical protein|nr:DUF3885 domain-containing protein [Raineya sp.]
MPKSSYSHKLFLKEYFNGLRLHRPLFYRWQLGLRFDLQSGDLNTDEYFQEVVYRASTIFRTTFDMNDSIFLVLMDYKYKRSKIRFHNFVFKQISGIQRNQVQYFKEKGIYDPTNKYDIRNIANIQTVTKMINYKNIFTAISHIDFGNRQPRLEQGNILSSKEVYFINLNKKLIFHMYDDRGLDIIAADKETLHPIYTKHNNWILDYDRAKINKLFIE